MKEFTSCMRDLNEEMKALANERERLINEKKQAYSVQPIQTDSLLLEAEKAQIKFAQKIADRNLQDFEKGLVVRIERKARELTQTLAKKVERAFYADPAQVDENALTLLNSGILSVAEIANLFDSAKAANNHTMQRLIAAKAGELADQTRDDPRAREGLNTIAARASEVRGKQYTDAFADIVHVASRCGANPALLGRWERIVGETMNALGVDGED